MLYDNTESVVTLTENIKLKSVNFEKMDELEFVKKVFKSTRVDELIKHGWSSVQIEEFLNQQFMFQHKDYRAKYKNAMYYIINCNEEECGRLYIDYRDSDTRILDIALLPEFRGKRIGSEIIDILQKEADEMGNTLSLHVENYNRAKVLYERVGFVEVEDDGVYILMKYGEAK